MRTITVLGLCGTLLTSVWGVHAAVPAVATLERIEPFADEYAVLVARLDVEAVDVKAWAEAVLEAAGEDRDSVTGLVGGGAGMVGGWLERLRAAGVGEVYGIVSLSYLSRQPPVILVVPLMEGGNAGQIGAMLEEVGSPWKAVAKVQGDCVVAAAEVVWRIRETQGLGRSTGKLRAAFGAVSPGVLQVAGLVYPGADRVIEELMPTLPAVVGGGSSSVITRGLRWGAVSVQAPPGGALEMIVQSESEKDAEAMRDLVVKVLALVGETEVVRERSPGWGELQRVLTPAVVGDKLQLRVDQEHIAKVSRQLVAPQLQEARGKARAIAIMNQLKQIALALHIYANEHNDQFPPHLADVFPELGSPEVLLLPGSGVRPPEDLMRQDRDARVRWVEEHSAFRFVLAGAAIKSVKDPGKSILVYQAERQDETWAGAGFADGHAEIMAVERLEELLRANQDQR